MSGTRRAGAASASTRWRHVGLGIALWAAIVALPGAARALHVAALPQAPAGATTPQTQVPFHIEPGQLLVPAVDDLTPDYSAGPMYRADPAVRWRGRLGPASRVARRNVANSPATRRLLGLLFAHR